MSGTLGTVMEVPPSIMETSNTVELPAEETMICASNCEDNSFHEAATDLHEETVVMTGANDCEDDTLPMDVSPSGHDSIAASEGVNEEVEVEVDITENVDPDVERVAETEPQDVTESSSSFGYTEDSGVRAGGADASPDMEVESEMRHSNTSLLGFDGFSDLFKTRKKKLTAHWRKFIRPLMWRCKWVELQLRELQSQACKYDRELAECEKRKQCQLEKLEECATEELGIKSTPFISQNQPVKLMKRKKRKRVEETADLTAYTSCHSLFSYFASKRHIADSAYMDDDLGNTGKATFGNTEYSTNAEWATLEFKDCDAFENILRKIEDAQSQVRQLRLRMDKVVREHAGKSTSDDSSFAPGDQKASATISDLPHVNVKKTAAGPMHTTPQQISGKKLPKTAFSCRDVDTLPDMAESTDQEQTGTKIEKMEHKILMHKHPVKEELDDTKEVRSQHIAEFRLATKGKAEKVQHVSDPNSTSKVLLNREQSNGKVRSISKLISPKNKRKRGRRKARSGRWSKRSSG